MMPSIPQETAHSGLLTANLSAMSEPAKLDSPDTFRVDREPFGPRYWACSSFASCPMAAAEPRSAARLYHWRACAMSGAAPMAPSR